MTAVITIASLAGLGAALVAGCYGLNRWARHERSYNHDTDTEPPTATDSQWRAAMHEPGPVGWTTKQWTHQFDAAEARITAHLDTWRGTFDQAVGPDWAAAIHEAEQVLGEWRHRVDAGCEDTAEWPIVQRREPVGVA